MQIKIENMICNANDGVVVDIRWLANKSDGNKTASISGGSTLPAINPSDESFIPFNELTEDQAKQWVLNELGSEGSQNLESQLDAMLNNSASYSEMNELPWAN